MDIKIIDAEKELGSMPLFEKEFKTGSKGFHATGKLVINGKRYQCNFLLVEIGSKTEDEKHGK